MAKFKCPTTFKGVKEDKVFEKDVPFEMTIKRADEIKANVKKKYNIELEFDRLDVDEQAEEIEQEEIKGEGE